MPGIRRRRLGSQLSNAFDCNYMTINQNSHASSASTLTVYVQNVRSLGVQINSNKFRRPIDQGCDIYIFVDARVNEPKMRQLWANFKVRMSNFQTYNTNSQHRGILILCKKSSGCKIENCVTVDTDSTVIFDLIPPDGDPINCAAVYGPSKDEPSYWEIVDRELSKRSAPFKCIAGDFNTTLNFARDTTGYTTDPHVKARQTLNGFIEMGKYTDIYDFLHPGCTSYTWVKDDRSGKRQKKASRIDHILVSPCLTKICQDVKHKYTGSLSDHQHGKA